jgi:hypothetical protein
VNDRPRGLVPGLPDALLAPLLDTAADVLRGLEPTDVPPALRPLIGFDRRGLARGAARQQLHRTLEADEGFRDRVVAAFVATETAQAALADWSATDAVSIVEAANDRDDLPLLASSLFAARPVGWAFGLGVACGAFEHGRRSKAEADDAHALGTRLTVQEEAARRAEAALAAQRARADTLETELREERRSRRTREAQAEKEVADARHTVENAEARIGRLTQARAEVQARVEREARRAAQAETDQRALRTELQIAKRELASAHAALEDSIAPDSHLRRGEVQALTEAAERASDLARALSQLTKSARRTLDAPPLEVVPNPSAAGERSPSMRADEPAHVRTLRAPVPVPPGMRDDSADALEAMLRVPGLALLIDGYNVSMQAWVDSSPAMQRDRLIAMVGALHQRVHVDATIVFDGSDVAAPPPNRPAGVRVVFSAADEEADAVIVREASMLPPGVPVVVVSSDRWVRDHAEAAGARVVPAQTLLALHRP